MECIGGSEPDFVGRIEVSFPNNPVLSSIKVDDSPSSIRFVSNESLNGLVEFYQEAIYTLQFLINRLWDAQGIPLTRPRLNLHWNRSVER
jgi:hypothetical protein